MKNNIENNKLIAEFMGCRYDENRNSHEDSEYYYEDCELEYHHNWNWLMEVVEKIENLLNGSVTVEIEGDNCKISTNCNSVLDINYYEMYSTLYSKLESTYSAVVDFIKWYKSTIENTTDQLSNRDLGQSTII